MSKNYMLVGAGIATKENLVVLGLVAEKVKDKLEALLFWTLKSKRNKEVLSMFLNGRQFQLREYNGYSTEVVAIVNGGKDLSFMSSSQSELFDGAQAIYGNVFRLSSVILVPKGVDEKQSLKEQLENILLEQYPIPMETAWKDVFLEKIIKRLKALYIYGNIPYQSAYKAEINTEEIEQDLIGSVGYAQFIEKFKRAPMIPSLWNTIAPEKFDFKAWKNFLIEFGGTATGETALAEKNGKEAFEKLPLVHQNSYVYGFEIFKERVLEIKHFFESNGVKFFETPFKKGAASINKNPQQVDLIIKSLKIIFEYLTENNKDKPFLVIRSFISSIGVLNLVELTKKPTEFINAIKARSYKVKFGGEGVAFCAADLWLTEREFELYQDKYINAMKKIQSSPRRYPTVEGKLEGTAYSWESMDMGNPRAWFVGLETNCCQHLEGAGSSCVVFAAENPEYSGMFRVMKNKETIAQSWFWFDPESGTFVFDNIEVLGNEVRDSILDCYYDFIEKGLRPRRGLFGIKNVTVGLGYNDMENITRLEKVSSLITIKALTEKYVYSDAGNKQVYLAKF